MDMKCKSLERTLLKPILFITIIMVGITFLSYLYGRPSTQWNRIQFLFWIFDLRSKGNLADWFQVILFALDGMLLISISVEVNIQNIVPAHFEKLIKLIGILFLYLSADQMLLIHKGLGERLEKYIRLVTQSPFEGFGATWLLIYVPVGSVLFFICLYVFGNLVKLMPKDGNNHHKVNGLFFIMAISIVSAVGLELIGKYNGKIQFMGNIFACFEESFEIIALVTFFHSGLFLLEGFRSMSSSAKIS